MTQFKQLPPIQINLPPIESENTASVKKVMTCFKNIEDYLKKYHSDNPESPPTHNFIPIRQNQIHSKTNQRIKKLC